MRQTWFGKKWFSLWLAAVAAVSAQPAPIANDTDKRVVVLGDSITAGYGLAPNDAYPALLQKMIREAELPYQVSNAGVSGDTTAGGLRRVEWAMARGADVLVVALGGNDGLRGIPPEETKKNLLGIIAKARKKNPDIEVLLAGMQMPDNLGPKFTARYKALFPEVAEEAKVTLIPFLLEGIGGIENLNQSDGIHPNRRGQEKIAKTVWKLLKKTFED